MLARLAGLLIVIVACAACQAQTATPAKPPPDGASGGQCGGFASPPCPTGSYCKKSPEALRGADMPGVCATKPQMCPMIYQPVCGEDAKTYPNACHAAQAGVNVVADGACAAKR